MTIENTKNDLLNNLNEIVNISYKILCEKISHGNIHVDNEPSFQLHFSYILKTVGQLFEFSKNDRFSILLESYIDLEEDSIKSKTKKARCDILLMLENLNESKKCAIELKYFKKVNHREPNNRYDYFVDLSNLESYQTNNYDLCFMIIGTDHPHYVNQNDYSDDTKDFDFRDGKQYLKGSKLVYRTEKPYGEPIILKNDYSFIWDKINSYYFLKVKI